MVRGADPVIPVKINSSGKSRSTLVPAQAGRMGRKRRSRRQAVESAIGAFKQVFRGDLMAQKEENAAAEPPGRRSSTTRRAGSRARGGGRGGATPSAGRQRGSRRALIGHAASRAAFAPFCPSASSFVPSHTTPPCRVKIYIRAHSPPP